MEYAKEKMREDARTEYIEHKQPTRGMSMYKTQIVHAQDDKDV
jgi:hypothetical protein